MDLLICCNMRKTSESIPAPLPNQNVRFPLRNVPRCCFCCFLNDHHHPRLGDHMGGSPAALPLTQHENYLRRA
jgi:hypothetical protein